jgi:hypothetical protein
MVLLAAGLLGDLLTLTLAVIPLVLAGALATHRSRDWKAGRRHFAAVGGGLVLAVCARGVALAIGTYSIGARSIWASPSQILTNIKAIPDRLTGLFGVTSLVRGLAGSPLPLRVVRGALLAFVALAVIAALIDIGRALVSRGQPRGPVLEHWRLDDLLVIAFLGDLASFSLFAADSTVNMPRYLVPGFIFAAVLSARTMTRLVRERPGWDARRLVLLGAIVIALCATDFGLDTIGPSAPQEASQLSTFLTSRGLRVGIGDYWSSSIVTLDTRGAVSVRPVDLSPSGTLMRYHKQSTSAWYEGQSFQFFVFDQAHNWHNVNAAAADKTFGPPSRVYSVGTYRVLVWAHDVRVAWS